MNDRRIAAVEGRHELGEGAYAVGFDSFVPDHHAVMQDLIAELPLRQEKLSMFGTEHLTPRLTSFHGDPGCSYRYSRKTFEPSPWTPHLARLRDRVSLAAACRFNSVLANLYRDGSDSMGFHSDDEPELGPHRDNIVIASVSLGAPRRFVLVHKRQKRRHEFALGEGSLFVMSGMTQTHYRHGVPKTLSPTLGPRLNLTFRVILEPPSR